MKVISIKQPWATLYVRGFKKIETRSRRTNYRGPILVHASAKFDKAAKELCKRYPFNVYVGNPDELPLGAIIGSVNIVDCQPTEILEVALIKKGALTELAFGDYSSNRFGYVSQNHKEFSDPIPAKGSVMIPWEYNGPVPELVKEALYETK